MSEILTTGDQTRLDALERICIDGRKVFFMVACALSEIKENFEYKGVGHNALCDCYNQIEYCVDIWNKLKNKV